MRIVSLCPSLTELVFDLGRGAELVGVTDWCVHPKPAVDAIEKVGGTKSPAVARIVELAPDLVLLNEEENRREDADALAAAGVRCHASFPRDVPGTAAMVRSIAAALERPAEGERIAREIERRRERVLAAAASRPRVRFAYLIWRKPWMSCNRDTFASELLAQAGGENVFADASERYPEFTPDELARARPELVLLCTEPFPFQDKHADELSELTGLARARFAIADGEYLSWHGSRTPDGIDYAERMIESARNEISRTTSRGPAA
ncbi:MAG: cobalamin-binding protein [Planctomycetota bacterium]|nr:MAG: cobalamin-binding protein [Planctomycetota bacterium]